MIVLEEPPNRWEPKNSNAAVLSTLRQAVDPIVRSMIIADAARHGALSSVKVCRLVRKFQGRGWSTGRTSRRADPGRRGAAPPPPVDES
jgi:hypothetical protein